MYAYGCPFMRSPCCTWKVTHLVIDSFTEEIEVSNEAIEFKLIHINVHGSDECGVHQMGLNPI